MLLNLLFLIQESLPGHAEAAAEHAAGGEEKFDAGKKIIEHIVDGPLIHLPKIGPIDMSITKLVFMEWLVAFLLFTIVTVTVRRYLKKDRLIPTGFMGVLEYGVEFVKNDIVIPNVGKKWVNTWAPYLLTLFFFILTANLIGMIPIFDVLGLANKYLFHPAEHSFLANLVEHSTTATSNYAVTAGLAVLTFFVIIIAGVKAHGFVKHWLNLVPHGLNPLVYIILIPIEVLGLFVRPFALTMRLAANMTGGHIAILALLSFVFILTDLYHQAMIGIGVGVFVSVPLAVAISALEIIVVLVQAYVFTLLTAIFIGMAIHVHH